MPRFNADEVKTLVEPISVTLNGKEYSVEKVTSTLLEEMASIEKSDDVDVHIFEKQLALVFKVDQAEFAGEDVRVLQKIAEFVTKEITEGVQKNAPKEPAAS